MFLRNRVYMWLIHSGFSTCFDITCKESPAPKSHHSDGMPEIAISGVMRYVGLHLMKIVSLRYFRVNQSKHLGMNNKIGIHKHNVTQSWKSGSNWLGMELSVTGKQNYRTTTKWSVPKFMNLDIHVVKKTNDVFYNLFNWKINHLNTSISQLFKMRIRLSKPQLPDSTFRTVLSVCHKLMQKRQSSWSVLTKQLKS